MKTMKFMKYCITSLFVMSFLLAFQADATMSECNVNVDINNSNCNDNTLVGGGGGCCDCCDKTCGSKKKKACPTLFEAHFKSTFRFYDLALNDTVKVTPYIQNPHCEVVFGNPVEFTALIGTDCIDLAVNQCLRMCFECDGTYGVGYIIDDAGGLDFGNLNEFGVAQISNEDFVCACNQRISVPDIFVSGFFTDLDSQYTSKADFLFCCCDNVCDIDCCDFGCNKGNTTLPFVPNFQPTGTCSLP